MLPVEKLNGEDTKGKQENSKISVCFDLVSEILSRLPVKSLLLFRSVSKPWLSLIYSPKFIDSHLSLSANNKDYTNHRLMLRISQPEYNLKDCSLKSLFYDEYVMNEADLEDHPLKNSFISFSIEGSINGLICLVTTQKELFLWNPAMRRYKKLPEFESRLRVANRFIYGFGYDQIHDDYKVVRVYYRLHDILVHIYSLKNDSWREIDSPLNVGQLVNSGKFVNGKLHWASTSRNDLSRGGSIISFDLADETWRKVERPCYGDQEWESVLKLGVLGNDLSMICNNPTNQVDVWIMKDYGVKESWTKMFTINYTLRYLEYMCPESYCLSKKGDEILLMFELTFMICNTKDNSIRYPWTNNFEFGLSAESYIESLVCPLSQNEQRIQQE